MGHLCVDVYCVSMALFGYEFTLAYAKHLQAHSPVSWSSGGNFDRIPARIAKRKMGHVISISRNTCTRHVHDNMYTHSYVYTALVGYVSLTIVRESIVSSLPYQQQRLSLPAQSSPGTSVSSGWSFSRAANRAA